VAAEKGRMSLVVLAAGPCFPRPIVSSGEYTGCMLFVATLFTFLLVILIPFFSVFVQTIKNLIFFILIVIAVCVNLMLSYGMEFFPIFFILVYIGAIVVSTLFMVLTFDLKFEYIKRVFSPKALFNVFLYFLFTPVLF